MDNSTAPASSGGGKVLSVLFVVALLVLVVVLDMRRRQAETKLMELSMKYEQQSAGNQAQNREAAKQIVEKVRRLYEIPTGVEPTVATIVDVNQLRIRNAFYNKAKNGDHLIVTNDRAILYDPFSDKIIDVVPVQIQPTAQPSVQAGAQGSAGVKK